MDSEYNMITVMGATAGGKTSLAVALAYELNAEIISADSRQIYKGMDIGTGKDLKDYNYKGNPVPYHLIDIVDAGYKYNVFEYQKDFLEIFRELQTKNKLPILCGGTGMYIEAVLNGYKLIRVPKDKKLRDELKQKSDSELTEVLNQHKNLHNISDTSNRKRLIRAVEIALYSKYHPDIDMTYPKIKSFNVQIVFDRDTRRKRITERLKQRMDEGMIEETKALLNSGVSAETLEYYGLEYKFLTKYVTGKIKYDDMFDKLNIAIHQFSKRQMTWFRKMEKSGMRILKVDGRLPLDKKIKMIMQEYK